MVTTGTGALASLIWRHARMNWHQSVIGAPLVPIGSLLMPGLLRGVRIYGSVPLPVGGAVDCQARGDRCLCVDV